MPENLGARLRQRREDQGIALVAIADQTKIKLSLLDGLERDDVSHWPSGIFRRAYIRAYAQAIGLNPDVVVHQFQQAHPEPTEQFEATLSQALSTGPRANGAPPTRLRNIVGSALDSLARLRRAPSLEDASPEKPRVERPSRVEAVAVPPHAFHELGGIDRNLEMADDTATIELAAAVEAPVDDPFELPPPPMPDERVIAGSAAKEVSEPVPDLTAIARLCTEFGRLESAAVVAPLLQEAAGLLDAVGLIVWIWDATADGLRPALASGYSDRVLAQLPTVRRDADNATAAAFRSVQTCAISGNDRDNGALVVPVLMPEGCIGVLALELAGGAEQKEAVRAVATILAALVAQLMWRSSTAEVLVQTEITLDDTQDIAVPVFQAGVGR